MRRAELQGLRADDIDLAKGDVLIRNGKGGKQRLVFVPDTLQDLLGHQLEFASPFALLPGPSGAPLSLRSLNLIVAACGRRAGIRNPNPRYRNITPHLLRHSMARNWKRVGGSLESLQKILGHSSMKTTMDLYGTEAVSETKENYFLLADRLVGGASSVVR
jgi:integrase